MPRREADWRDDAACLHADPDLFFPIGKAGPALLQVDEAKRVCAGCPVREPCLEWAMDLGVVTGVWGGSTEDERRAMRRTATRQRYRANEASRQRRPSTAA